MKLCVTPLTGSIGAAVDGVRLDEPIDDRTLETLRAAFAEHCTLVFRDQYVKPLAQIEFARLWGEPVVTEMLNPLDGHPEIFQVANVKKETTATEAWHYDGSFTAAPPKITMLSAITTPVGGDTMWSNQYLAVRTTVSGNERHPERSDGAIQWHPAGPHAQRRRRRTPRPRCIRWCARIRRRVGRRCSWDTGRTPASTGGPGRRASRCWSSCIGIRSPRTTSTATPGGKATW